MYLTQALHRARLQFSSTTATVCGGRRRTYAELANRVERLAAGIRSLGIATGQSIGMLANNSDRYLEYYLASYWAGGIVNPVNTRWSAAEIAYSLDDCETRLLIVDEAHRHLVENLRRTSNALMTVVYAGDGSLPAGMISYESLIESSVPIEDAVRRDSDIAGVFYTGGTTGSPKGVVLTHQHLYTNALTLLAEDAVSKAAIGLHVAPMFHMADVVFMNGLLMRGSTHVMVPTFDPVNVLKTIDAERITDCVLVPTMIQMLVDHPGRPAYDISSVRRMIYGASPIDESLLDRALTAFSQAAFFQGYGMTELSPLAAVLAPEFHSREHRASGKLRSAGRAALCAELRILDESGQTVPIGTVGEIAVRSPCAMRGYLNKPEETAAAFKDGWVHTGDGGYLDADGFLYVVDRLKDMIVTGGENVFSIEVENALLKHPSIAACAVIGVPDADWGERVHAVIVLRTGIEAIELDAIREHARQYIASYKCPRSIEVRSTLPLSAAGKVLKKTLREPYWQGRTRRVS